VKTKMNKIVGIGAAVVDTLITLPRFPEEDTKLRAESVKLCGGGPAATGLAAAGKLGVPGGFIGVLSDDAGGRFLKADFEKYGVDTSLIEVKGGCRSFTSCIWLNKETGSRTCVFDKGSLPPLSLNERQKEAVRQAEILMVDGNDLDAAVAAARIARQSGTKVLYDAGGLYEGVERLLALTDLLIPSEEFALKITGEKTAERAAEKLMDTYRPEAAVVTCGKRGGVLVQKGKTVRYPIYPAEVLDSNGAGDVFHGAFAAAAAMGYSYEQCCHFSSAVSALKCTGVGARESVPDFETVTAFLAANGYRL